MAELIQLQERGDARGKLVVVEGLQQIPFEIARIFYIYDTSGDVDRGNHANRNSRFAFVCLKGSVKIDSCDGKNQESYTLDHPTQVLVMDKMVWKKMYAFSEDAVLLVLSDCKYDAAEYINDYDAFLKEV